MLRFFVAHVAKERVHSWQGEHVGCCLGRVAGGMHGSWLSAIHFGNRVDAWASHGSPAGHQLLRDVCLHSWGRCLRCPAWGFAHVPRGVERRQKQNTWHVSFVGLVRSVSGLPLLLG